MKHLLITAETDEAHQLIEALNALKKEPLHLPLEKYRFALDRLQHELLIEELERFRFVIYGGKRNARFFLTWVEQSGLLDEMKNKIHLVMNQSEADMLEEAGIPAILPRDGASAIDMLEFMLRISQQGAVIYPCAEESSEEIPGLLQELEMPVIEFTVCRSEPMNREEVEKRRAQLERVKPGAVLFHSRGSVIRTKTAFPSMDLSGSTLIAASAGVAGKLEQEGLRADLTAAGSWRSVLELIQDGYSTG